MISWYLHRGDLSKCLEFRPNELLIVLWMYECVLVVVEMFLVCVGSQKEKRTKSLSFTISDYIRQM